MFNGRRYSFQPKRDESGVLAEVPYLPLTLTYQNSPSSLFGYLQQVFDVSLMLDRASTYKVSFSGKTILMTRSETRIYGTQFGSYLWSILICINKESGCGSFSTLMPYPPVEERSIEFYATPEGDFSGTIVKVHEAVSFAPCEVIQSNQSFGLVWEIKVKPSIIEFQVWVNLERSNNGLSSLGVPEL